MNFRSKLTRLFFACYLATFLGCVEYRFEQRGQPDRYLGWANSKRGLDPKLGSKGKLYLIDQEDIRPYIGGNLRRNDLRINFGVVYYINDDASIELGYRKSLFNVDHLDDHRIRTIDPFKDAKELFYIGGVIKF